VRSALEGLAARLAVPRITDDHLAELGGHVGDIRSAARDGDGHFLAEADARFHSRIVELADNGTLHRVWRSLEPFSRTYMTLALPGADPTWSANLHAPILAALEAREVEGVVSALRQHFDDVSANMAGRWPEVEADVNDPPP
jgi:DNA-binding GntR family transcriptional regulator